MKAGTFVLQTKPGDTVEYQSHKDDYICVHHHKNGSGTVYIIPRLQQKPIQCYTDSDYGNVYMIRSKQNNQTIRRCIWDPGSPFHIDCDRTRLHNVEMIPHARKNNANVGGVGGKAQIEGIGSWSPGQGEVRLIPTMRTALFSSQQYIDTHDGHFTQTRQHILYTNVGRGYHDVVVATRDDAHYFIDERRVASMATTMSRPPQAHYNDGARGGNNNNSH